jgi:hypothetical protein
MLGRSLARTVWARVGRAVNLHPVTFQGNDYIASDGGARDFHIGEFSALVRDNKTAQVGDGLSAAAAPMMAALADRAGAEWTARW